MLVYVCLSAQAEQANANNHSIEPGSWFSSTLIQW